MSDLGMSDLADRYTRQLMALFPVGAAWPRDPGSVRWQVMAAIGAELAAVHTFLVQVLAERSPRTATRLLAEWEAVLGLPDDCVGAPETIAERRRLAHARMVATGGQSRAYFVEQARTLGFDIEIIEYRTRWCGMRRCGEPFGGEEMQFTWRVVEHAGTVRPRRFGEAHCGEPFTVWGNRALVCMLRRLAPAHTEILFD